MIRAVAFAILCLALLFVAIHYHDRPRIMVGAAMPTENAPLTALPMLCTTPSPHTGRCDFTDCERAQTGELT